MRRDVYNFGIDNLRHTCRLCAESSTTHYISANKPLESGYYCSRHTEDLPMYKKYKNKMEN